MDEIFDGAAHDLREGSLPDPRDSAAGPDGAPLSERMAVLRLLEQGKITAAEATELLKALREPGAASARPGPGDWAEQAARRAAERAQRAAERAAQRGRRAAEYWGQHADEVATRAAEHAARTVEQVGENVSRIFANLPDFMERAAKAGWGAWGAGHRFEEVVEGTLEGDGGPAGLDIEGWNGAVVLRPVDGTQVRLVLKKTVHAAGEAEARELASAVTAEVVGRQVTVRRMPGAPAWPGGALAIEAYLPRAAIWGGVVGTDNGQIDGEGLQLRGLRLETSNGRVRLADCTGQDVGVLTSNGGIETDGLRGKVELRTSNGAITVHPAEEAPQDGPSEGQPEIEVTATTTNGAIRVHIPAGIAVDVDATTSNGRFDVAGLGPSAPRPDGNRGFGRADFRWRSPEWKTGARRAQLTLRTTNGSIRFD